MSDIYAYSTFCFKKYWKNPNMKREPLKLNAIFIKICISHAVYHEILSLMFAPFAVLKGWESDVD
jgi:hypothetical protein